MRAISPAYEKLLTSPAGRRAHVRVKVKDHLGVFRDLTTYVPGVNMVVSASWGEDVDSNGYTAEVEIRRRHEKFSANPLQEASALNRGFNPSASYAPLLDIGREILVEWALTPVGLTPSTWVEGFRGYVDTVDISSNPIKLVCRDQSARIIDAFIRRERVFNYAQGTPQPDRGCYVFETGRAYLVDDLVVPTEAKLNGRAYRVTIAGTSAATEPDTWPTTLTDTIVNGGVTFRCEYNASTTVGVPLEDSLAQLLKDNVTSPPAIFTPTSPAWQLRWWLQQREGTWSALRALVEQIGWDFRFKWDDTSSSFRLSLWTPDRSKTLPDRVLGEYDGPRRNRITKLALDIANIRNVVRVIYSDYNDKWPDGTPRRKTIEVSNQESINAYGERFMEVAESSNSNIDTSAEATTLANSILNDLSEPLADFSAELPFFPFAELGDLYRFPANTEHFSTAQDLATVAIRHSVSLNKATTTLACRGKVCGAYRRWLKKDVRAAPYDTHAFTHVSAPSLTVTAVPIVGGMRIKTSIEQVPSRPNMRFEHHLGDSSGFTPSSSTIQCVTEGRDVVIPDQVPGKERYHKVVPVWFNFGRMVRGEPSAATAITSGRGAAAHLQSEVDWGRYPLNGGFETKTDANGPPDHWTMALGTWATDMDVATSGLSGARALEIKTGTSSRELRTGFFDATEGDAYYVEIFVKAVSGSGEVLVQVEWFDVSQSALGSAVGINKDVTTDVGSWVRVGNSGVAPSQTRYGRVRITKASSLHTINAIVDAVRVVRIGEGWHEVGGSGEPAFANSWVNYDGGTTYAKAAFRKDAHGRVHLKGQIKSGTVPARIFTLPAGYRPLKYQQFVVMNTDAFGLVTVRSDGEVHFSVGTSAPGYATLNGICFETF